LTKVYPELSKAEVKAKEKSWLLSSSVNRIFAILMEEMARAPDAKERIRLAFEIRMRDSR